LGIKETALIHISEMSDHFVKDPLEAGKVGDVLEFKIISLDTDRRRIGLSRKSEPLRPNRAAPPDSGERPEGGGTKPPPGGQGGKEKRKAAVVVKAGRPHTGESRPPRPAVSPAPGFTAGSGRPRNFDDDGTMYNPFAEALKKMREKK
ncbi:MAG: S1 RNA-binding domain-containing protein, partial [Treponema sp.]|nr:S1 RNA-binding domain-containing protein [Treponema sp.]